jgi:hypothetical protein
MGTGFIAQGGAVLAAPLKYLLARSLEHGDVERLDLHLLDHLGAARRGGGPIRGELDRLGMRLTLEPLERPRAALLDFGGDRRQRHDPAQVGDIALIGEGS